MPNFHSHPSSKELRADIAKFLDPCLPDSVMNEIEFAECILGTVAQCLGDEGRYDQASELRILCLEVRLFHQKWAALQMGLQP